MRSSFTAILVLLLFSSPLRAQDTITLLIRGRGMISRDLIFVVQTVADILNKKKGILVDVPFHPLDREDFTKSSEKAAGLLEEAKELYRKFDEQGALSKLAESRAVLIAGCGGADAELLGSQVLLKGLIHFTAGRRNQAKLAFSLLAALDPSFRPDTTKVAPKVVAALKEARDEVMKRPPGLVDLAGRPPGAKVLLNGREAGSLPAVLDKVPPGNHCIQVTDPAHSPWVARVTMPEKGNVRMRAVLFPDRARTLLAGKPGIPRDTDPGELARVFSTDYLALGDASDSEVTLRLISARSAKVSAPVRCRPSPSLESLLPCLHDGVVSAHEQLSVPPKTEKLPPALADLGKKKDPPPVKIEPAEKAWYQSWWFWTIVGGAALAGTAVALGVLLSPDASNPDYWVTVTRP